MYIKKELFVVGKSFIFAFVGDDGLVKSFETIYETKNQLYGSFDCGIEIRVDGCIDDEYVTFFNVTNEALNDYINSSLYVFSSREKAKELLPKIIQNNLETLKKHADVLLDDYMKTVTKCTTIESYVESIKNGTFELNYHQLKAGGLKWAVGKPPPEEKYPPEGGGFKPKKMENNNKN
jgi:hypothetical protein